MNMKKNWCKYLIKCKYDYNDIVVNFVNLFYIVNKMQRKCFTIQSNKDSKYKIVVDYRFD